MAKNYYAVIRGKNNKPTIYNTWSACKKAITGASEPVFKGFDDFISAKEYIRQHCGNVKPNLKITKETNNIKNLKNSRKLCPICEKPHNYRTKCCATCNKKKNDLDTSIAKLLYLRKKYNTEDIFEFIKQRPYILFEKSNKEERIIIKKEVLSKIQSEVYRNSQYEKWNGDFPLFLKELFKNYPTREFLTLSGTKSNPNIHYKCKACGEEYLAKYKEFHLGHGCETLKSSGEVVVEDFLKGKYDYLTQRNTLECPNPITNRPLPYDFEIRDKKILIEVQGNQHYQFTEHFHSSIENFKYQLYKDQVKKEFAESRGYSLICIDYEDIENGSYKEKILSSIMD